MSRHRTLSVCSLLILCSLSSGCHPRNHTEAGALVGSGLGALAGGVIGHQSGNTADGALVGGLVGGLTGAVLGNTEDVRDIENERRAQAVTNFDLITMTQGGLADEVIVNTVKIRGGQLDLSPQAVLDLKANGVSDGTIIGVQKLTTGDYGPGQPQVVVVPPARVGVSVHPHHHRRYWHRRPEPSVGFGISYSR